jgi:DNA-binding beta-propeller fold protein YncE
LGWPNACPQEGANTGPALVNPQGAVAVVGVASATADPHAAASQAVYVPAGCSPVRLALAHDGKTVYVTARASNQAIALDATKFLSDPLHAMTGAATVGTAPVPVALIQAGKLLVVGNSNRFREPLQAQSLDVLDATHLAANADGAVLGSIPTGAFPREFRLAPDGKTLFLANYGSNTLQVIRTEFLDWIGNSRLR